MMKRWIAFFCVAGLIIMSLAGCGGSDDPSTPTSAPAGNNTVVEQDSAESYTAFKVRIKGESLLQQLTYIFRVEDTLLGVGFLSDGTFQLFSCGQEDILEATDGNLTMGIQNKDIFGDRFVMRAFPGMENVFYTVERELTETGAYYLCSYDINGNRLWETDFTESVKGGSYYINAGAADNEGRLYFSRVGEEENSILILDSDGTTHAEIRLADRLVTDMAAMNGQIWCVVQGDMGTDILCQMDTDKNALAEEMTLPEGRGSVSLNFSNGDTLLFDDYEGVKEYDTDTGELTRLYTWLDAGVTGKDVSALFAVGEKSICALMTQGNGVSMLLLRADSDIDETSETPVPESEKIEIVLQGYSEDTELLKVVNSFNLQSDKYRVVIRTYTYDSGRLEAELISGNGPDLLNLTDRNIYVYADKGMLEDLTPYLEQSDVLSREQLNQHVLELYTTDDVIYCIPATFSISTVEGPASELGTEAGWTLEEFRSYVDSYPGATVFEGSSFGQTQTYLVWNMLWGSWDKVIDYEERKAYFDSDYFKELLEYAANYDARYDSEVDGNTATIAQRLSEKKLLLLSYYIGSYSSYRTCQSLLNGDVVFIGWPTEEGIPHHGIFGWGAYGISASSENKEGAWEFIEYLVSSQTGSDGKTFHNCFPTLIAGFEGLLEYEKIHWDPAPTDEELEEIRQLIETPTYRTERSPVESIILEEVDACLSGARSVEDTARIIQNRVQLYLDEM